MRYVFAALAALCLAACELEPGDRLFLSGRAQEADGSPWRGGPLVLARPLPEQPFASLFEQPVLHEPWRTLALEADGSFLHALYARDIGAGDGHDWRVDPRLFRLQLPPGPDGAQDWMRFTLERDADLPPLRRWNSGLRAEGLRLYWQRQPAVEDVPAPTHTLQVRSAGHLAWSVRAPGTELQLSPELLEDFPEPSATVVARAEGFRRWVTTELSYTAEHTAAAQALPSPGLVPASRGAACATDLGPLEPCPFTDGRVEPVALFTSGSSHTGLTLRLNAPLHPARLVVRGLASLGHAGAVLQVEGSADGGVTWQVLGSAPLRKASADNPDFFEPHPFLDLPLAPGAEPVTQLRLRVWSDEPFSTPSDEPHPERLELLREVSVFAAP